MSLQRFDKCGEKGYEAFGTDPVGGVPDQRTRRVALLVRNGVGADAEGRVAPTLFG